MTVTRSASPKTSLAPFICGVIVLCGTMLAKAEPPDEQKMLTITREQASTFAKLALKGIRTESPHAEQRRRGTPSPREMHPAFYGCYDWHSAVHSHWMLVRLLRRLPDLPQSKAIRKALGEDFTAVNLKAEADYFASAQRQAYERPYGWGWLLKLAEELHRWDDADGREWAKNLKPLTDVIVDRFLTHFPKQASPIRVGTHTNTSFGLALAYDFARTTGHKALRDLIEERSRTYFGKDTVAEASREPGRADFLSPSLTEADLMRRILPKDEFHAWLKRWLPNLAQGEPKSIFEPAKVSDRNDAQNLHLDGLNLSRAWCMRNLAQSLPADDPARKTLMAAAIRHAEAALPHVASGNFAGEHWLPSFAVNLLTGGSD